MNKLGSNQYLKKPKHNSMKYLYWYFAIFLLILFLGLMVRKHTIEQVHAEEAIISPLADPIPTPTIPTLNPNLSEREQNINLIKKIWGKDSQTGLALARCESGYRTHATNYNKNNTVDQGVFQINSIHSMPEMENPVANILYAYAMYQNQGVNPWSASRGCWGN